MLKNIHIKGFKCFSDQAFALGKLNILTGFNGAGKTSLLNLFAVLHQSICETGNLDSLVLNGPVVSLGNVSDVLNKAKSKSEVTVIIETSKGKWERDYKAENREDFKLRKYRLLNGKDALVAPLFRELTYLSADRQGPREMHALEGSDIYQNVGVKGERTINRLSECADQEVLPKLRLPDFPPQVLRQTEAQMRRFFPGFSLTMQPVKGTNLATLGLTNTESIGFVRPQNTGFGLSYTLPVCVAALCARSGNLLMLENPEAHLHPSAQSGMGHFLADVASAGIQLMVETHSDHFLNGVRKSVKNGRLSPADVRIFFFVGLDTDDRLQIVQPRLTEDGKLTEWPKGFFDQYDLDLDDLIGW